MDLIFSDLHLDLWRDFNSPTPNGLGSRLSDQVRVVNEICKIAISHEVDGIYFLGDLFNNKGEKLHKLVLMVAASCLKKLSAIAPTYLITGNHDIFNGESILSYMADDNTFVVSSKVSIPFHGRTLYMVPYGGMLPDNPEEGSILFGHYGIRGAICNTPMNDPMDVSLKSLLPYQLVMMGHYHTRQIMNDHPDNLSMHTGAVMYNTFSDTPEARGVWLLGEDLEPKCIPIRSPIFRTWRVKQLEHLDFVIDKTQKFPNDFHKIVMEIDVNGQLPNFPNILYNFDSSTAPEEHYEEQERLDTLDKDVQEFIEKSNTVLDKNKLWKMAAEILENV